MRRELTLELVRVTEGAALAASSWVGRGDKEKADQAAVDAMRRLFETVQLEGEIVIGEGEMDEAPMLYIGEKVGAGGDGSKAHIAVDPLEGTNLVAKGLPGAIAVLAVAPEGGILRAPDCYMDKIAVGPAGKGVVSLDLPPEENVRRLAQALGKPVSHVTVVILDRPRHQELIRRVREAGARIRLISDGDVAPAVATGFEESGVDMVLGIGGAPEGVLAAAALACLGGDFQGRLILETEEEKRRAEAMGVRPWNKLLTLDDLVPAEDVIFAATGITGGDLLRGVRHTRDGVWTDSIVLRRKTGTVRRVEARHQLERKPVVSQLVRM
ncbi:MAG: class II fructose-bisphosphatase [Clostridiales bacterium]|nr:class II fructose-bisphosphatase [Clostridiales bacterium]